MTTCNVKGVTCSDKTIENCNQTQQFPSALRTVLESFSLLFWFYDPQLGSFSQLSSALFPDTAVKKLFTATAQTQIVEGQC